MAWMKVSLCEIATHRYLEGPGGSPGEQLTCTGPGF